MNNGAYAGLRRAPRAAMPDPENDELPEDESAEGKDKETNMDKTHTQADVDQAAQAAATAAAKAANERFSTVLASEHYAGRETLAHSLLAKDVLSAADIIETLQAAEKKTAPEASADEGSTMLSNMRSMMADMISAWSLSMVERREEGAITSNMTATSHVSAL